MRAEERSIPRPLNRGGNALLGVFLLMSIFGLGGPLIGGVAALGPLALFGFAFNYGIGLTPALIAGGAFSALWLVGVQARYRTPLTMGFGIVAAVAPSWSLGGSHVISFYIAWAAGLAGLACCLLADLVLRAVERDRSALSDS